MTSAGKKYLKEVKAVSKQMAIEAATAIVQKGNCDGICCVGCPVYSMSEGCVVEYTDREETARAISLYMQNWLELDGKSNSVLS